MYSILAVQICAIQFLKLPWELGGSRAFLVLMAVAE